MTNWMLGRNAKMAFPKKYSGRRCVYCGEPADTQDHIPPKNSVHGSQNIVPACKDCNCYILRDIPRETIKEGCAIVIAALEHRIRCGKPKVWWSEAELKEMGPNMRKTIRRSQTKYQKLLERLETAKLNFATETR
jgi:hypothetical protein